MLKSPQDVPHLPGCYALIHRAGGICFVGASKDLHQRWIVWRSILSRSLASQRRRGFPDLPVGEWEFKIVLAREGLTDVELQACVDATMAKALRQGLRLLNRGAGPLERRDEQNASTGSVFDPRAHALSLMPVPIIDTDGEPLTYAEAAKLLGRAADTVKISAKRLRERMERAGTPLARIELEQLRTTRGRPRR